VNILLKSIVLTWWKIAEYAG